MSKNIEYKGKELKSAIAEEHIEAMSSGTNVTGELKKWAKVVYDRHVKLRGDPLTNCEEITDECCVSCHKVVHRTKFAFRGLKGRGRAYDKGNDTWVLREKNYQVLGKGKSTVYLYYFPKHREYAESQGESAWACKLGMTSEPDVRKYIRSQLTRAHPENFHLTLKLKTDDHITLETQIKNILKVLGRHKADAPKGTEWFITNAHEVITIYDFIHEFGSEVMFIGGSNAVREEY